MSKFIFLLFNFISLSKITFAQDLNSISHLKKVDSAFKKLNEIALFNGVVVVAHNGNITLQNSLGYSDLAQTKKLDLQSSFNLASISKQFVAMLIMIQKEKKLLSFEDPVSKHLPSFPYPKITIRHLLTHTSGLPEYFELADKYLNTLDTLNNAKMLNLLALYKPNTNFPSGQKWEYCNTGYILLASIIEKNAGTSFEEYFQSQIAIPLGLKNTYVFYLNMKKPDIRAKNRVIGFERNNGKYVLNDLVRLDGVVGDGNIYSSAEDLLIWAHKLKTLVKSSTWKEATTAVKLNNSKTHNYGFGWFLDGDKINHTGSWVGFNNRIEINEKNQSISIVLASGSNGKALSIVPDILHGKEFKIPVSRLINNINLIDGTGTSARKSSVRLLDKKIWEIGNLKAFENEEVVDGQGKILAPGFIDSHSHHYGGLMKNPAGLPATNQGITTIVIGQDGGSYPMDTLQANIKNLPVSINIASYTGHSTLRAKAMGVKSLFRTAKPEEVEKMKGYLEHEMKKGSLGLNTGLEYESAFFSNKEEVLELAKVAAKYGGRYMSHIRSEDINIGEALDEILNIGKQTGLPVQISHIKIAKKDQWGKSVEYLAKLQKARSEGINITADCYPYNFWNSTLRVLFPNRDYKNLESAEFAVNQLFDPSKSVLVRYAPEKSYAGKTIGEIAQIRNETPALTLIKLIALASEFEEKNPDYEGGIEAIMAKSMDDTDVSNFLKWPQTNICSDGSSSGHPRGHGTFTRVLGRYVREQNLFSLETAIYKMTGLTAENIGISDRGIIEPGRYADMVLFDPETVIDNADIKDGKALSSGILKVWVNGEIVLENNKPTGKYPGILIKRQSNE